MSKKYRKVTLTLVAKASATQQVRSELKEAADLIATDNVAYESFVEDRHARKPASRSAPFGSCSGTGDRRKRIQLCAHVWKANQGATRFAWLRLNQSMREAVYLAVNSGMHFAKDDFERFISEFRGGYWIGANHEGMYATAVKAGNLSACHAYEHWQQRKPFIFVGSRMFVGRDFHWEGRRVHCTSISQDAFIAVAPKGWEDGAADRFNNKPDKRFRITREQIKACQARSLEGRSLRQKTMPKKKPCDRCVALMINGVYCHEIGCPNAKKPKLRKLVGAGPFRPGTNR